MAECNQEMLNFGDINILTLDANLNYVALVVKHGVELHISIKSVEAELMFLNTTIPADIASTSTYQHKGTVSEILPSPKLEEQEQPSEATPPLMPCPILELCSELPNMVIKPPYIIQTLGYGKQLHPPMKICNVAQQGVNAEYNSLFIKFLSLNLSAGDVLLLNAGKGHRLTSKSNKLETIELAGLSFSIIFYPAKKRDRRLTGFQMLVYADNTSQTHVEYCISRALSTTTISPKQ
ncbi:uncharacterized protein LOC118410832 [Branchiostoma floridae]|uniref:Uncharacterized protein LOC118410832 n=1 Tax=Branchiostoma floridae TaxID=7739 RepID=A0A9J7KQV5_BRAFL|nr:uncharacterized protein LOC118410832 [Branchiostoma floridae]